MKLMTKAIEKKFKKISFVFSGNERVGCRSCG